MDDVRDLPNMAAPQPAVRWAPSERQVQLAILAMVVAALFTFSVLWFTVGDLSEPDFWRTLGYPGVFLITLIGSAALVLPVPSLLAVCGAGGIELSLIGIGLLTGVAETIGEMSAYAIGYGGRSAIEKSSLYARVRTWTAKRGTAVIFVVALVPSPFFDVVGIAAGGLRYPVNRFVTTVWTGKTLKGLIVTHTCFWLAQWLPFVG